MTRVHGKHAQHLYWRAQGAAAAGNYGKAQRIYRALIRQLRSTPPQKLHVDVYRSLGDLYRILGRYRQSDASFAPAFKIADKIYAKDAFERWPLLNGRAVLCKYSGRFAAGARLYRSALRILTSANGSHHCEIATIYHNLGGLEHARGRYAIGEKFARKGIAIRRRALGANHVAVVADEAALAALLIGQKKFGEAEILLGHALRISRRASQPENYDVAIALSNLGSLQHARGNFVAALRCHKQALRIKRKLFGPHHVDVAVTLNNLAVLYREQGRRAEALSLFSGALSILRENVSSRHPNFIKCKRNHDALRKVLSAKGREDLKESRSRSQPGSANLATLQRSKANFTRKIRLRPGLVSMKAS